MEEEEKPADHLQKAAASEASAAKKERVELMMALGHWLQPPSEPRRTFQSVFPSVVPCTVMYKISYCADRGSWPLPVYTEKWQSWGDVVGVCISHEPISECSCCF